MNIHPLAIAVAAAAGGAAVMVVSGASGHTPPAQSALSSQLLTNQRISQAAVRRANTALNYMGVVRTPTLDNQYGLNKSNPKGVTPLAQVSGAGQGWQAPQIRDGQVTSPKVADGAITRSKMAAGVIPSSPVSAGASTSFTYGAYGPTALEITGDPTPLVYLSASVPQATTQNQTGPLTLTAPSRVTVNWSVAAVHVAGGSSIGIRCYLEATPLGSSAWNIEFPVASRIEETIAVGDQANLASPWQVDLDPGSYDMRVACYTSSAPEVTVAAADANITVIAIPR